MITPWYRGQTAPSWSIPIVPDSNAFIITGLSTSNFALRFIDNNTLAEYLGGGVFSNLVAATSSSPASINYKPVASDSTQASYYPSSYTILLEVTYPSGDPDVFKLATNWQVSPR